MSLGITQTSEKKPQTLDRLTPKKYRLLFRLYVTPRNGASVRALANLKKICREHLDHNYEIEVVDTQKHPQRAKRDGVTATPTLIKRSPAPIWTIVGDLSEEAVILAAMKRNRTARRTR
jgi:circadian clock protein KaiB